MLNVHPNLKQLPEDVTIVIVHGLSDELYTRPRAELEQLIATGTPNMCYLYTTSDSGQLGGVHVRKSDTHNMASLLTLECLPRLVDACLSPAPEMQMMWSWRTLLDPQRIAAEEWLGCKPEDLTRRWTSEYGKNLQPVQFNSEEFQKIATLFLTSPKEVSCYRGMDAQKWQNTSIRKIERVENNAQMEGSSKPYYESLQRSILEQGLAFEPTVHTRWAFHGTPSIESVVNSPMAGFQPLKEGPNFGSVFGYGTYFARDAKFVADANMACKAPDGTSKILLCLVMSGMTCCGSPEQHGVLPFRQQPHRYNSSVDSLSSPEIFIMQHPSSAYPAYVITFC
jgi:hypothetical protein